MSNEPTARDLLQLREKADNAPDGPEKNAAMKTYMEAVEAAPLPVRIGHDLGRRR